MSGLIKCSFIAPPPPLEPEGEEEEVSIIIPKYYDVDLEKMHYKLYYNDGCSKDSIQREQEHQQSLTEDHETVVKAQAMLTHTRVMVEQACDQQFDIDCHRMYERMRLRNPMLGQPKNDQHHQRRKISDYLYPKDRVVEFRLTTRDCI
ncbi:hypothetical protein Pst134EA_007608 [Puccinia striiformis f. sp. tritici]|uniref:hypothetical protein n=1 Tax=Puccinia striiformis f. sp. tritici TaxID=168172 RepID=UPI002008830F|nr:hypothetical protein Pst134EA_007608 [Puccinia striiformis f. sp. tritici]KAH9470342.1 hypothetical protein Pst134EA_007608 [Puccinia striiformis f. sp. tritici]